VKGPMQPMNVWSCLIIDRSRIQKLAQATPSTNVTGLLKVFGGRILTPLRGEFPDFIPVLITPGQIQGQQALFAR